MPAGRWSGSACITGSRHVWRAALEGIVFGFRHHVEVFAEHGLAASRVFAADGGAASDLWLQIAADVLGLPVTPDRSPSRLLPRRRLRGRHRHRRHRGLRQDRGLCRARPAVPPRGGGGGAHEPSLPAVAGDLYEVEIPLSPTYLRENPGGSVAGCRFSAQAGNKNAALAPSLCSASRKFRCAAQEQLPRHFRRSKAGFAFARTSSVLLRCFGSLEPAGRQSGRFFYPLSLTSRWARSSQSGAISTPQPGPSGIATLPSLATSGVASRPTSQG